MENPGPQPTTPQPTPPPQPAPPVPPTQVKVQTVTSVGTLFAYLLAAVATSSLMYTVLTLKGHNLPLSGLIPV